MKAITLADLGLSKDEMELIASGAREHLSLDDPRDEERLRPTAASDDQTLAE